ncbi:hypothetical protein OPT61_g6318 [Boeremia exigua]|uniref:Uncharacterized protein n=1 Tax=Boeremia exigua TaxID=749465 RepID=A0ACC2I768_9PLEO|nr:hypothetical protein OPT61_g6318 [Boeremia exigua]
MSDLGHWPTARVNGRHCSRDPNVGELARALVDTARGILVWGWGKVATGFASSYHLIPQQSTPAILSFIAAPVSLFVAAEVQKMRGGQKDCRNVAEPVGKMSTRPEASERSRWNEQRIEPVITTLLK